MKQRSVFTRYFSALPPYLGGKRKLVPWIFGHLNRIVPKAQWPQLTLIDAFLGGGSVSLFAKAQGFRRLLVNDWSERSQLISRGLLENDHIPLRRETLLTLTQPLPTEIQGFVKAHFSPSVFSSRHAEALDRVVYWSDQIQDPFQQALAKLLLWHLVHEFVCMGTSINSSNRPFAETLDGLRDWQSLNPKRFTDGSFPRLLQPTWKNLERKRQTLNQGIFRGSPVSSAQLEASAFLSQAPGDILYLDPPYAGTLNYEDSNRVLDAILTGQLSSHSPPSPFSQGTDALTELLKAARHIPIWLLSYGDKAVSLPELIDLVKQQVPNRTVVGHAQTYAHLPHVSQRANNQELLIIAY